MNEDKKGKKKEQERMMEIRRRGDKTQLDDENMEERKEKR